MKRLMSLLALALAGTTLAGCGGHSKPEDTLVTHPWKAGGYRKWWQYKADNDNLGAGQSLDEIGQYCWDAVYTAHPNAENDPRIEDWRAGCDMAEDDYYAGRHRYP